ncbi:MAG TPA: polyprenol monophosphomannose synthase [Acidimicrobiales bacterium]|nr:polyprenol monophosphomannose synthase [Acidimicrobiales bacterium]
MRTLVVLPTYQEAANVAAVLARLREAVPEATILVVDDASPDGTADLAEVAGRRLGNIEVLRRPGKDGLGSAYRAGFAHGLANGFEVMVEIDADGSHDPGALPSLLAAVEAGADLAIGSRYVPGGAIPDWPRSRRLISVAGNRYVELMLRLKVKDATAGFRAYRASILRQIDLPAIRADGYGFQVEMAYRVARRGGRIVEVPITFTDRIEGDSKMSWRIVFEAFALVTAWGVRDRLPGGRGLPQLHVGGPQEDP